MASIYQRKKSWWISYYIDGKRIFHSLHTRDKKVAEHLRKKKELEIEEKRSPLPPAAISAQNCVREYIIITKVRKAYSTIRKDTQVLNRFVDWVNVKDLQRISCKRIEEYLNYRKETGLSIHTVKGDLGIIKKWFNWSYKRNFIGINPCLNLAGIKAPLNPIQFLNRNEIHLLLEAAKDSHLYTMAATAVYAGLRVGELRHLEWTDINFEKNTITVQNKHEWNIKSKKFRVIPLNQKLKAILLESRNETPYCFLTPDHTPYKTDPKRAFHGIRKKIPAVKKITWQILRKTFGSQLAIQGVSLLKIQKWLGHSDPRVTLQHYAHLSPDFDQDINKI